MLLANAFPFLNAYHQAVGYGPDEIEEVARRAWDEGAPPQVVVRAADGSWLTWRELDHRIDPELRAKVMAQLQCRAPA